MSKIIPVILCGGIGTRLWPLSRSQHPKQFQPIDETGVTFFQSTVQRHAGKMYDEPLICVSVGHVPTVSRQLRTIKVPASVIAEPVSRNTGAALLAAALTSIRHDPEAVLLALPSDHVITGDFDQAVVSSLAAVNDGLIVTFGIEPRYPESGYGYIIDGGSFIGYDQVRRVARFIEKPATDVASSLIEAGGAYWASGISMFRADTLICEFQRFAPESYDAVVSAVARGASANEVLILHEDSYALAASASTESTIFEKTDRIALRAAPIQWDDVGAWSAFHNIGLKGDGGNVSSGDVVTIDTENSYIRGSNRLIAVVGMTDVVIVDTPDALLVTTRQACQNVKKVVERLIESSRPEVVDHRWQITDWGRVGTLSQGGGYLLKQIVLNEGMTVLFEPVAGRRSLITIAEGIGYVKINGIQNEVAAGATIEIGPQMRAAMSNAGTIPLQAIEVSCDVPDAVVNLPAEVERLLAPSNSSYYA
jgi:mannose-1-phosphate guanylyltransferase/mannose-6-phosphate isomerase